MRIEFFMPMKPPTADTRWQAIPGFGNKYQVSDTGMVQNKNTGQILKPILKSDGYLAVNLSHRNKAKMVFVHRLVAEAFIPNPKNLPVVNHIDGNKANPCVANLEWVSFSENSHHAYRTGLSHVLDKCKAAVSKIAAENGRKTTSRPIFQLDSAGKVIQRFPSAREAARSTGISRANILRACKIEGYSAGGFKWKREG